MPTEVSPPGPRRDRPPPPDITRLRPLRTVEEAHFSDTPWLERGTETSATRWRSGFPGWTYDWEALPEDQKIRASLFQLGRYQFDGEGVDSVVRGAVYGIVWGTGRALDWILFHWPTGAAHVVSVLSPLAGWRAAYSQWTTNRINGIKRRAAKRAARNNGRPKPSLVFRAFRRVGNSRAFVRTMDAVAFTQYRTSRMAGRFGITFVGLAPVLYLHPVVGLVAGTVTGILRAVLPYFPDAVDLVKDYVEARPGLQRATQRVMAPLSATWEFARRNVIERLHRPHRGRWDFDRKNALRRGVESVRDVFRGKDAIKAAEDRIRFDALLRRTATPAILERYTDPINGSRHHAEVSNVETMIPPAPEPLNDEAPMRRRVMTPAEADRVVENWVGLKPGKGFKARRQHTKLQFAFKKFARGDETSFVIPGDEGESMAVVLQAVTYLEEAQKSGGKDRRRVLLRSNRFGPVFRRALAEGLDLKGLDARHPDLPVVQRDAARMVDMSMRMSSRAMSQGQRNDLVRQLVETGRWRTDHDMRQTVRLEAPDKVMAQIHPALWFVRPEQRKESATYEAAQVALLENGGSNGDAVRVSISAAFSPPHFVGRGDGHAGGRTNGHGNGNGNGRRSDNGGRGRSGSDLTGSGSRGGGLR